MKSRRKQGSWDLTVTGAAYECLQRRCFNFSRCRIGSLVTEQIQLGESCSERLQNELKELSGRVSALEAAEGLPFRVFFSWSVLLFERLHITSSAVMVMAIMSAYSA